MLSGLKGMNAKLFFALFQLCESIIFMFFVIKLHRIDNRNEKIIHYLGIGLFIFILYLLNYFEISSYLLILLGFISYPLCMKLTTRKSIQIAMIEYLYYEFFDFTVSLIFALFMYTIFSEESLKSMNTVIFLTAYFTTYIIVNYISYLTLGKKIFSLFSYIEKIHTKDTTKIYVGAFLFLIWISLFYALNLGIRDLYFYEQRQSILFLVFSIITILIVSVFTVLFILEQRQNYHLLTHKSSKDILTGAMNNLFGMEYLNALISNRKHDNFALVFVDIDNLKMINDKLGHAYGNIYICYIVESIRKWLGEDDCIIRYGGDEFLVIMHHKREEEVMNIMDITLSTLKENAPKEISDYNVSFSYGISIFDKENPDQTAAQLIVEADKKMYLHKNLNKKVKEDISLT